jgi:hypothetical protein
MSSDDFTFRGQRDGEDVLMVTNRHAWSLAKPGLIVLLGAAFIIFMFIWFHASKPAATSFFVLGPILLLYTLYEWYIWSQNFYILTNERVIVASCKSLLSRKFEDYGLEKIQSLGAEIHGLAASTLGFGTVTMAIMGIKDQVALKFVEDAYDFQSKIQDAIKNGENSSSKLEKHHKRRVI